MRKYAFLKEPLGREEGGFVYKIMLCTAKEGVYLFEYDRPDALLSSSDRLYDSLEDLFDDWNGLVGEKGWIDMEDPLPDCQHDAFVPLRVKGRGRGKPEWGKFETLIDGNWVDCPPENQEEE